MPAELLELNETNFDEEVLQSTKPVIVDFWAEWCGPCRMMAPVFEELAGQYGDQVKFAKLDVDANQNLAIRYRVMSIPTVIVFRDGEPVEQMVGFRGKEQLEKIIRNQL